MRRVSALVCVFACVGAGCTAGTVAASGAAAGASGIAGKVVAAPTCPVETVPPSPRCAPRPLAARLRVFPVGHRAHARLVYSGRDGRFSIRLAAGSYEVQPLPKPGSPLPRPPAPTDVQVHVRRFTHITITYDTGIR